jgi:carboxypeptidase C (cathepsin A)
MIKSTKWANSIFIYVAILCILFLTNVNTTYGQAVKLPADTSIATTHKIKIGNETVPYKALVGTMPVYKDSSIVAALQYVYYKRTDVKNEANRPLLISFNGGPGTGNLWMHIGYTSPVRVKVSPEGMPVQPYGVVPNHHSVLDATDIVYISPVNTGFSRILNDGKRKYFFGVNEDLNYLSDWIERFISRYSRWDSPKFLIGESYGSVRVSGLAGVLQGRHDIYLNGVILQGNCIQVVKGRSLINSVLNIPTYAATAWYYKKLSPNLQKLKLSDLYSKVEKFAIQEVLPAVTYGGDLSSSKRQGLAGKIASYTGLSKQFVLNYNLVVPNSAFWKELLRDKGKTVGRLDTRYVGIDSKNGGARPEYSPEIAAWNHSFVPAMNSYIRQDLGFKTKLKYNAWGNVHPWDNSNMHVVDQLRRAMQENPALHLFNQQGYFDNACTVAAAKYTLWQLDASGKLKDRIRFKAYKSGHMLYVRDQSMIQGNKDLRQFIKNSIPKKGQPIKYNVKHMDLSK